MQHETQRDSRFRSRCPLPALGDTRGASACFPGKAMRCTKCGRENPESQQFCGDCGSPLGNSCARCGVENPAGQKYCGDCGASLSQPTAAPQSADPAAAPVAVEHGNPHEVPEGERRHLTVLFCDLVGSTAIASHLDPEEWREIVADYHRAAAQANERTLWWPYRAVPW